MEVRVFFGHNLDMLSDFDHPYSLGCMSSILEISCRLRRIVEKVRFSKSCSVVADTQPDLIVGFISVQ